jgi:hypothetical protein
MGASRSFKLETIENGSIVRARPRTPAAEKVESGDFTKPFMNNLNRSLRAMDGSAKPAEQKYAWASAWDFLIPA